MSKVMQQLKHSERSHLASGSAIPVSSQLAAPQQAHSRGLRYLAIALVPPTLIAAVVALQTYQSQKQWWLESNVSQTVSIEVPFGYQVEAAPDFGPLAVTYQQPSVNSDDFVQDEYDGDPLPEPLPASGQTARSESANGQTDLLQGIDLSGLSPELAQRFETVLNSRPQTEKPEGSDNTASNLSHQPERWYGKLPAMNFQTHVYSSKANKRWVKINGVEYSEGDWISNSVELVAIEQQACLIRFEGELIEVPALYDWKG
ncbi:general secretion pathway protein GspB [Vibrio brasiliensis]|uniref:general secretion pathway protein GspB n=1 Tax=Vibrio brasiliensis TaxID=170652 RepID=UPI001EFC90C3|nr:general secretion pathway protein GspB [Vibrio brasiliensis]MCG9726272.1 general secretion pathway protein GspB [Vibrio brasiliensis]